MMVIRDIDTPDTEIFDQVTRHDEDFTASFVNKVIMYVRVGKWLVPVDSLNSL